ncbi:MAG: SNF2-related protein [Acinetobacter tjernbergiae]
MSLMEFLSRFSTVTIQRSANYMQQIDPNSLDLFDDGKNKVLYAQIEGNDYYDTTITYSVKNDRLIDTDCSCPVGDDCKHAAALARFFYQNYRHQFQNVKAAATAQNLPHSQATHWLNDFKRYLQQTEPQNIPPSPNHLIYILTLSSNYKLKAEVRKTRHNKNGSLAESTSYTSYENILNHRINLNPLQRDLFSQLYVYARINAQNSYYQSNLDLSGMSLAHFKQLIQSGDSYWEKQQHNALTWTEQCYQIQLSWQRNETDATEKLCIEWLDQKNQLQPKIFNQRHILPTQPPCFIDLQNHIVGSLKSEFPADLLYQFKKMPELSRELIGEFEHVIRQHRCTQSLPKPQYIQNIETMTGNPQAILRFGVFPQFNQKAHNHDYSFAEVEFAYLAGRVKAGETADSFIADYQGKMVRQQRNFIQEQQAIQRLKQRVPSLKWVKNLAAKKQPDLQPEQLASLICAVPQDWTQQLIPVNQIEQWGWTIEHLPTSLFNLQLAQHIEFSLLESKQQQDWFNIGATVQDQQGNRYDLLELLANLVQRHPTIVEPAALENLDNDGFFSINIGSQQPDLVLKIKEIKPILQHLGHILEQENRSVDRYDASQLLELQHHLGMSWQSSERLKQFAEQLKLGYQQQLPTPQGFQGELRPYQQQGLAWLQFLRATAHGGILADDMGLGKTAQTLAHLLMEKQAGALSNQPALIVAPTSLMQNWFREAQKFTPDLKVLVLQGQQRKDYFNDIPNYDVILTTYPLLSRDEKQLQQYQYHVLILDEAQNIKNPHAKAAQVARQLQAKHRLCLTGTPMENHLGELWSLFYFLMPGFLYQQDVFNKKYRHPIEKHGDQQLRQKLVNRIKPFMLRRLKTEVAKELPAKTTIEINIDMSEQQTKLYEAVRATMQKNIQAIIAEKGFKRSQIQILDALLKLRQVCCHPSLLKLENIVADQTHSTKLDHLLEMVSEMVEEGRKILIFSQFTTMLQLIEDGLKQQKIDFVKLTGKTKKRDEVITVFQSGRVPVFLISLKAGGVGLNLTAADTVIHYDPWWNPAAEDQASDRAWRIGQDKPVFVYKLITNQSIEEKILALQKNKALLTQSILSTDHEGEVKLSEEDVMKLFDGF